MPHDVFQNFIDKWPDFRFLWARKSKNPEPIMNITKFLILPALVSATLTSNAQIYTMSPPVANSANGHTYYLLSTANWTSSEAFAQTLGGHLATVNDHAENTWIFNTFATYGGLSGAALWIGLNDSAVEDTWVWSSGETASYRNWYTGQPSNTANADPTGEDYAAIRPFGYVPAGSWNDLPTDGGGAINHVFGVVEVVPEPQSLALLALGLGACFAIRRRKNS
jgi:hypothetical protein